VIILEIEPEFSASALRETKKQLDRVDAEASQRSRIVRGGGCVWLVKLYIGDLMCELDFGSNKNHLFFFSFFLNFAVILQTRLKSIGCRFACVAEVLMMMDAACESKQRLGLAGAGGCIDSHAKGLGRGRCVVGLKSGGRVHADVILIN